MEKNSSENSINNGKFKNLDTDRLKHDLGHGGDNNEEFLEEQLVDHPRPSREVTPKNRKKSRKKSKQDGVDESLLSEEIEKNNNLSDDEDVEEIEPEVEEVEEVKKLIP